MAIKQRNRKVNQEKPISETAKAGKLAIDCQTMSRGKYRAKSVQHMGIPEIKKWGTERKKGVSVASYGFSSGNSIS